MFSNHVAGLIWEMYPPQFQSNKRNAASAQSLFNSFIIGWMVEVIYLCFSHSCPIIISSSLWLWSQANTFTDVPVEALLPFTELVIRNEQKHIFVHLALVCISCVAHISYIGPAISWWFVCSFPLGYCWGQVWIVEHSIVFWAWCRPMNLGIGIQLGLQQLSLISNWALRCNGVGPVSSCAFFKSPVLHG